MHKWLWPGICFTLLLCNLYVWKEVENNGATGLLQVSFLDVGQGDSGLVKAPNGAEMLIDGGETDKVIADLNQVIPGDNSIDLVLATHPHADHIGGLRNVLEKYDVGEVVDNGVPDPSATYTTLEQDITEEKAEHITAVRGMRIVLDDADKVYFDVLYPYAGEKPDGDQNDMSIVGKLTYGSSSFMLMGDAPKEAEENILQFCGTCVRSDVLKAGHHGSKTSSGKDFVEAVHPQYAVISVGKGNTYGHPNKETLDTFASLGIPALETENEGTIIFESDGKRVWRK